MINLAFENKFQITLQPSQEGSSPSLTLEPVNKTKMITSIDVWLQAFHALVGIFTSHYPHENLALKEKLDTYLWPINCKPWNLGAPWWAHKRRGPEVFKLANHTYKGCNMTAQTTNMLLKACAEDRKVDVDNMVQVNANALALLGHISFKIS